MTDTPSEQLEVADAAKAAVILGELRELAEAEASAREALRAAVVAIMAKPPEERGVTTYQIADAIKRSRQQLHQINRNASDLRVSRTNGGEIGGEAQAAT